MSLFRSASGPGGLSINTGAANSLAPPASQPANTGGLFGSGTATTGAASAPATAAPAMASTGSSLFGGQKTGGGLFGASTTTTANNAAPAPGGGLFGNASTQQTPKLGGSLFGNAQQNTAATGPGTATGGGLFGNASTAGQQQQGTTGGGLFGGQTQNNLQQPQQSTGGGLFGNATTATNTQTGTTGGGLFGQSTAGGLLGQNQQQQQMQMQQQNNASISAVQVNYDSIRPRSRFDDLAKPVQDEIALIDKGIQRVIKMKDEIGEFMPQHERDIDQLGRDVKFVESKFRSVQVALHRDVQTVKTLQDMTKKNIADAQLSFKATDNLKLPTHYHTTGLFATSTSGPPPDLRGSTTAGNGDSAAASTHASAQDLITYFNRVCDNVEKYKRRLDEYRSEIERDLPGVEHGLYEQIRSFRDRNANAAEAATAGGVQDQLGQVLSALRELGNAIIGQAGQIADTRERLSRLQAGIIDSGVYAAGLTA